MKYEIFDNRESYGFVDDRAQAFNLAKELVKNRDDNYSCTVYSKVAKRGQWNQWRFHWSNEFDYLPKRSIITIRISKAK